MRCSVRARVRALHLARRNGPACVRCTLTPRRWSSRAAPAAAPVLSLRTALKRSAGCAALLSTAVLGWKFSTDEGFYRSAVFWTKVFPIYSHYRWVEWKLLRRGATEDEEQRAFDTLHERYAPKALEIILEMGGFYVKIGQIASLRDDCVPPQYMERLKLLQDSVPAQPIEYVYELLEQEWGTPWQTYFSHIDEVPLGAASIGQVHRAILHPHVRKAEDGPSAQLEVAIKIQYPEAERTFAWDLHTIKDFASLVQPVHLPFLRETERQFATEFDYRLEARNLERVSANLRRPGLTWRERVVVPMPVQVLCTRRVLCMEYLDGVSLTTGLTRALRHAAASEGLTVQELQERERARAASSGGAGELPEWARVPPMYRLALQARDYCANLSTAMYNYSVGWWAPRPYAWSKMPIDVAELLQLLWEVHGHELFVDGFFNGDPHPGNIMLLEDGRIGLIDYGQAKELDMAHRVAIAKLLCALAVDDETEVVRVMTEDHGFRTKHMNARNIYKRAQISWNRDDLEFTEGKNIQLFYEQLGGEDPVVQSDPEFILATRMCVMLRGLGSALRLPQRPAEIWLPQAQALLQSVTNE